MIRAELHCHTTASVDGMMTPEGMLRAARPQGINVVAVTDHDTQEGAAEVRRWFAKQGADIQVLVGEERTLDSGCHLMGLFLREPLVATDLAGVVEEVRSQGGLVLVPHPFRRKDGLLGPRGDVEAVRGMADAMEAHNAKGSFEDNERGRALRDWGPVFGGSDAHYEADLGLCVNELDEVGSEGVEGALRAVLMGQGAGLRIMARRQKAGSGERKYAPGYYAVRRYAKLPKVLLPGAKKLYRWYWNARFGGRMHPREEIFS